MHVLKKLLSIGLLAFILMLFAPAKGRAQDINDQDFYDYLTQYGTWVSDPQYGDVWVPDVDGDFRPYASRGHWVLTEYGNTWVSDYPWGWATFHYGRWHYDDYYGWEWVPGYEWAPAWVSWRQGGGYYGWAPLSPGISLSVAFGGGYSIPDDYWVCAPYAYINRPNIYNYYAPHSRMLTIIPHTTIINNTYIRGNNRYIGGPRPQDIERYTHQRPQIYHINNSGKPGPGTVHSNSLNIYRPAVTRVANAHPPRVVDGAAYRLQFPTAGIGHKAHGAAPAFNHVNAARLATVARSTAPDNKVVHVNARPAAAPAPRFGNPVNRRGIPPAIANKQGVTPRAPATAPSHAIQPENRPSITHENRPAAARSTNAMAQHEDASRQHTTNTQVMPHVQQAQQAGREDQQRKEKQHAAEQQGAQQAAQRQQQQASQQAAQRQQQAQQRKQQQAQQQAQQRKQQQAQQQAQQAAQRQQQQASQQAAQRQQQAQQRQQQQAQQQAQQAAQRQQPQASQQAAQRQQQQAQQQAQQAAQRQQQQAQQAAQRQQQAQQRQQHQAPPPPKPEEHHP